MFVEWQAICLTELQRPTSVSSQRFLRRRVQLQGIRVPVPACVKSYEKLSGAIMPFRQGSVMVIVAVRPLPSRKRRVAFVVLMFSPTGLSGRTRFSIPASDDHSWEWRDFLSDRDDLGDNPAARLSPSPHPAFNSGDQKALRCLRHVIEWNIFWCEGFLLRQNSHIEADQWMRTASKVLCGT